MPVISCRTPARYDSEKTQLSLLLLLRFCVKTFEKRPATWMDVVSEKKTMAPPATSGLITLAQRIPKIVLLQR